MKIVIDPGHGGSDGGASWAGVLEKDIVLDYSLDLANALQMAGHQSIMTRVTDQFVGLSRRAEIANEKDADLLISIHANASVHQEANGAWIIFDDRSRPENGEFLSQKIFARLAQIPGVTDLDTEAEVFADGTAWVGYRQLTVISKANCIAVLIELGFLTNQGDLRDLQTPNVKGMIVAAIVGGITDWVDARC